MGSKEISHRSIYGVDGAGRSQSWQ